MRWLGSLVLNKVKPTTLLHKGRNTPKTHNKRLYQNPSSKGVRLITDVYKTTSHETTYAIPSGDI